MEILRNRAIFFFIAGLLSLISGRWLVSEEEKKNHTLSNKKKLINYSIFILVAVGLFAFGFRYYYYSNHPQFTTQILEYIDETTDSKMLASECYFVDSDKNDYHLTFPFETEEQCLGNETLQKNKKYSVTYEKHALVITKISKLE